MLTKISWQEGQERLLEWAQPAGSDRVRLRYALFHYLDAEVPGKEPYPLHSITTERGYALSFEVLQERRQKGETPRFRFGGTLGGARSSERQISRDQAFHVEAGTILPDLLDVVVPEEGVQRDGGEIVVTARPARYDGVFPRGRFVPADKALLARGRRITCPDYAALYSQPLSEVSVLRKPTLGSLIIGSGLCDAYAEKTPEGASRELLSPLMSALCAERQFPYISLGVQEAHSSLKETLLNACEQAELLVVSGILSSSQLDELRSVLAEGCDMRISGLSHPLAGDFLVADRGGCWLFFLPYHPPMIHALAALLIFPFVVRMMGDRHGWVPYVNAVNLETANAENPGDDIWVGEERFSREFGSTAEVKLICQISQATIATLTSGTCLAIPRTSESRIEAGSELAIIRY